MPSGPKILFVISELKTHNVLVCSIDCGFRYNYFGKISLFSFLVAVVERSLVRTNCSNENLNNVMMLSRPFRLITLHCSG